MRKYISVILSVVIIMSSVFGISVLGQDQSYLKFSKSTAWELETAPTVMPETIEVWFNVDPNNTSETISIFGNAGRNVTYIPQIELWLGRKEDSATGDVYYLPRMEYYNVRDWGYENKGKAYYLNNCVINPGEWNHLVVTRDASAGKLYCYLNNSLVQTALDVNLKFEPFVTDDTYVVGGRLETPNNSYFNGDIASIAVYSDTRTKTEVSNSYSATSTSKDLTDAVAVNDSALICAYDLYASLDCKKIENAKTGGTALIENMWVESSDPTDYAYSFAVVGDTQKTNEYDVQKGTDYLGGLYNYINNNAADKKIAHVFGLGDITDDYRVEEWEHVRKSTDALTVPYSMLHGNHDPEDMFNTYYGAGTPYAAQVAGHYGTTYTHTYHTFTAGATNYLVVAFGWDPNDAELDWANKVIESHPNHSVIVTTHAYLFRDGERITKENSTLQYNDGNDIWNELIKHHENIVLVIGGHDVNDRIMMKQSVGDKGNTVTELLINPQGMDEKLAKAGDIPTAMVAMLYFSEDGKNVDVRYYSTSKETYFKNNNQFSFSLERHIGTKGNPVVMGSTNQPVVTPVTDGVDFYKDHTVKATFTGALEGSIKTYSNATTAYSSEPGTYYGSTPGSLAVTLNGFTTGVEDKKYGGAQVQPSSSASILPDNLEKASYAFWVNVPEDLYMRVYLFAYRHNGTSGEISFYSTEFKVNRGASIVEIPLSNFTVSGDRYISSAKNLNIFAHRFYFRSADTDITGKTVYIDNFGIYQNKTAGFGSAEHKDGVNIVENFDGATVGATNSDVWIHGTSENYISTEIVGEVGADNAYAEGGKGQSLKVSTLSGVNLNQYNRRFDLPNFKDNLTDEYGNFWGDEATLAIWIKTNRAIDLKVIAGASVKWNASTGANHWACETRTVGAGESILRIPVSAFKDKVSSWSGYANAPDWSSYIGRLVFYVSTDTAGPLEMYIDNIAVEYPAIGDISLDGTRDILDIVKLHSALSNLSENDCYGKSFEVGDANSDGVVDEQDLIYLRTCNLGVTSYKTKFYELVTGGPITDGSTDTYWSPATTDTTSIGIKTNNVTFNVIDIQEYLGFDDDEVIIVNDKETTKGESDPNNYKYNSFVKELIIEAKVDGKFTRLCKLDEVGTRSVLLDKNYTASEFRITATFTDARAGISEISFRKVDSSALSTTASTFRNVGYFTSGSLDMIRENSYDKLSGYTDVILFDYGSWNEKGEFLWGSMNENLDEDHFAATVDEIRAQVGENNIDIWFCLQNYDKKNVTDTETLFATEESREALANFALSVCEKYNLAGVDIDYEYPGSILAWRNYGEFLVLCAEKLHAKGYKLSAAISSFGVQNITADVQGSLDYVNMMVYDLFDSVGRHSPYSLARRFKDYYTGLGFAPEKLVLGLPYYSRTYETVNNYHQIGGNGYRGLYDGIMGVDYTLLTDPSVNVVNSGAKQWTYYFNGAEMIEDKVLYALEKNMSGVFCWSMAVDVPTNNKKGIASLGQTVIDTINRFK